jgi:glyoxylase-like metal-dependent hydrolase (beta-lactamase superfamily II)
MALPDHVHALPLSIERDGREAPRVPGGGDGDGDGEAGADGEEASDDGAGGEDAGDDEGEGPDRAPPVPVDVELGGPATIRTRAGPARVVPTPGHTPGHVSVYLPESGTLLAADALTAQGGELHGPRPDVTEDVETGRASVARLAELDVERVLCYHGGLVAADAGRLAEIAGEG